MRMGYGDGDGMGTGMRWVWDGVRRWDMEMGYGNRIWEWDEYGDGDGVWTWGREMG